MSPAEDPLIPLLVVTGLLALFIVTLASTDAAIIILIISMLLSPELNVGGVPSRAVVIRVDDFILIGVSISWLAKMAVRRELGLLRWTQLHGPLLFLTLWFILVTSLAILTGDIHSPKESFFYLLKYIEYFLVFFLGVNVIRERRQVDYYWRALLGTALVIGAYGWWQHLAGFARVSAPFEGEAGEPNTLAGYLVLMMGVLLGRALLTPRTKHTVCYAGMALFLFVPLLWTLSRGGYLGFAAMYLLLLALAPKRRAWLAIPLVIAIVSGPAIFPEPTVNRVETTYQGPTTYGTFGEQIGLDPSAAHRVDVWPWAFEMLKTHPLIGYGIAGAGLIDVQYCLVLVESGLIGALLYLWTRWLIFLLSWRIYHQVTDPNYRGLVLGYLCAYVGLLVHSFAGNIFIIVRIMEPFWFLTAMVLSLPHVLQPAGRHAQ